MILTLLAGVGVGVVAPLSAGPAQAAPGTPGFPGDPVVLYSEDFENAPNGSRVPLGTYVGTTGESYTADPYWLSEFNCNGMVIDSTTPWNGTDCAATGIFAETSFNTVNKLANILGQVAGSADPATNGAVSAYTDAEGPNNAVEFQTVTSVPLPSTAGRFVTFSVDAAVVNCKRDYGNPAAVTDPSLHFYLKDASGELPVAATPINPCADGTAYPLAGYPNSNNTVRAGSYVADGALLLNGGAFDVVMRNEVGAKDGNDHAFDNIRVLDVTPQLDKSFSPTTVPVGGGHQP